MEAKVIPQDTAAEQIEPPLIGEIAAPDVIRLFGRDALKSQPYMDALTPSDSVLKAQGGIGGLKAYRELLRDDQVAATWQQRRRRLIAKEWQVEPGADDAQSKAAADFLKEELDRIGWDDVCDKMLYAVFYGWSVAECLWTPDSEAGRVRIDRIVVRDRARFRFGATGALILNDPYQGGLVRCPPRKFWVARTGAETDDEPYGLGLAHALYWPVWFKRNGIKFWLVFLEKFGQPTALAKVPAAQLEDETTRANAVAVLRNIAQDSGVVVPDSIVVEFLEAARSGTADYESMCKAMDAAISKIVLSQTMTTDNGSSRSQAQVHDGVADAVVKADDDLLASSFMQGPARWLTEWNFPGAAVPRVYRNTEPPEDLNERAKRDGTIAEKLGFRPTEDYVRETYGDGWERKPEPTQAPPAAGMPPQQQQPNGAAAFAEGDSAALRALAAAAEADQEAMVRAAVDFAANYEGVLGQRVGALISAAQDSEDFETMRERLREIAAEAPPAGAVQKLARAGLFARLMGAFRAQR